MSNDCRPNERRGSFSVRRQSCPSEMIGQQHWFPADKWTTSYAWAGKDSSAARAPATLKACTWLRAYILEYYRGRTVNFGAFSKLTWWCSTLQIDDERYIYWNERFHQRMKWHDYTMCRKFATRIMIIIIKCTLNRRRVKRIRDKFGGGGGRMR